jgi:hypothetical protein
LRAEKSINANVMSLRSGAIWISIKVINIFHRIEYLISNIKLTPARFITSPYTIFFAFLVGVFLICVSGYHLFRESFTQKTRVDQNRQNQGTSLSSSSYAFSDVPFKSDNNDHPPVIYHPGELYSFDSSQIYQLIMQGVSRNEIIKNLSISGSEIDLIIDKEANKISKKITLDDIVQLKKRGFTDEEISNTFNVEKSILSLSQWAFKECRL